MTESSNVIELKQDGAQEQNREQKGPDTPPGKPSNEVYARVGDIILQAARDGVRRNLPAKDIVQEIRTEHGVHLSVGELRLLLASRRIPG